MSEVNPNIGNPLVHHRFEECDSKLLDYGMGLSWRNFSPEILFQHAVGYERNGTRHIAHMLLHAALLKEDAIKHGINLEDKL